MSTTPRRNVSRKTPTPRTGAANVNAACVGLSHRPPRFKLPTSPMVPQSKRSYNFLSWFSLSLCTGHGNLGDKALHQIQRNFCCQNFLFNVLVMNLVKKNHAFVPCSYLNIFYFLSFFLLIFLDLPWMHVPRVRIFDYTLNLK